MTSATGSDITASRGYSRQRSSSARLRPVPDPATPEPDDLVRAGVYDPDAPGAGDRLELIRYALDRGATLEEVASSSGLGDLALDLTLRPGSTLTVPR
jgi:hypothetical protein